MPTAHRTSPAPSRHQVEIFAVIMGKPRCGSIITPYTVQFPQGTNATQVGLAARWIEPWGCGRKRGGGRAVCAACSHSITTVAETWSAADCIPRLWAFWPLSQRPTGSLHACSQTLDPGHLHAVRNRPTAYAVDLHDRSTPMQC